MFDVVIKDIFKNIQENSILILEVLLKIADSDKEHNPTNKGVVLAYCPERLAEGLGLKKLKHFLKLWC